MNNNLDEFGEIFISEVRDRTIRIFDKTINGFMKSASSQALYHEVQKLDDSQRELIKKIISRVTDLCLHNMLCMFEDYDNMNLLMYGDNIKEVSDGLAGELYTEDGWIEKYSKQRIDHE